MSNYHSEGLIIRFPTTSYCTRALLFGQLPIITNAGGDQPVEYYENTQKKQNINKICKICTKYAKYVQNMPIITNTGGDQPIEYYGNIQKMQNMKNMKNMYKICK